jgi:anti-anti-sigma regulatory factor
MGLRIRLLLALAPLALVVLAMVFAAPLLNRQMRLINEQRFAAAEDLVESLELQALILHEHHLVGRVIEGDAIRNMELLATRARILDALAEQEELVDVSQELDQQLAVQYGALSRRHDDVLELADRGSIRSAEVVYANDIDRLLNGVFETTQEISDLNEAELNRINRETLVTQQRILSGFAIGGGLALVLALSLALVLTGAALRPIRRLAGDAERYIAGDFAGRLSPAGNIHEVQVLRDSFQNLLDVTHARRQELEISSQNLARQLEQEQQLRETVAALDVPVIPLQEQMLLLPLIGHLDERRAGDVGRVLLTAIRQRRARRVLLDVSGLVAAGPQTAAALRDLVVSARLLGADLILVGVRAEQAPTLIEAGIDAQRLKTARDVSTAINGV